MEEPSRLASHLRLVLGPKKWHLRLVFCFEADRLQHVPNPWGRDAHSSAAARPLRMWGILWLAGRPAAGADVDGAQSPFCGAKDCERCSGTATGSFVILPFLHTFRHRMFSTIRAITRRDIVSRTINSTDIDSQLLFCFFTFPTL